MHLSCPYVCVNVVLSSASVCMCPTGTISFIPCTCRRVLGLPCLALPAESARPPTRERLVVCAVEQIQETTSVVGKEQVLESKTFNDNPSRFNQLQFVKSFIVHAACLFSIAEHARIRRCLPLLCPKQLQVDGLNNKAMSTILQVRC